MLAFPVVRRGAVVVAFAAFGCSPFLDSPDADFSDGAGAPDPPACTPGSGSRVIELKLGERAPSSGQWSDAPAYLKVAPPVPDSWFGYSLARGGNALAIASPRESISEVMLHVGAVYVIEPHPGALHMTRLEMPNAGRDDALVTELATGKVLLSSMAVALDDDVVIVGMAGEDGGNRCDPNDNSMPEAGALYLFDRARLDQPPRYVKPPVITAAQQFGYALALSDDWLIVGAPGNGRLTEAMGDVEGGSVYAYRRQRGRFELAQHLNAPNWGAGDHFGVALALDGDRLAIAATTEDSGAVAFQAAATDESAMDSGAVYVYRLVEGVWTFKDSDYLKAGANRPQEAFGASLSLSGDTLAVGAPYAPGCPGEAALEYLPGAVHVFRELAGTWQAAQCFSPDPAAQVPKNPVGFGFSVALEGDRLLVGAPWESSRPGAEPLDWYGGFGSVYSFVREATGAWSRLHLRAPNADQDDLFGVAVAHVPGYFAVGAAGESGSQSGPKADLGDNGSHWAGAIYLIPAP